MDGHRQARYWTRGLGWLLTGAILGFALYTLIFSIGIFILPVPRVAILWLVGSRTPGAPMLISGKGLVTPPWTLSWWPTPWPLVASVGLSIAGVLLFRSRLRRHPVVTGQSAS